MSEQRPETKKSAYDRVPIWAIVALFSAAAIIAVAAFMFHKPGAGEDYGAKKSCQRAVQTELKAPASAGFSGEYVENSGMTWTVRGAVDSDNSFGAKLRSTYVCKVKYENDNWTLVDLDVSQN